MNTRNLRSLALLLALGSTALAGPGANTPPTNRSAREISVKTLVTRAPAPMTCAKCQPVTAVRPAMLTAAR